MSEGPIPFVNALAPSTPALRGASPTAANVVMVGGALARRPGIQAYSGAPSTAIHTESVVAVHEALTGKLYAIGEDTSGQRPIYLVGAGGASVLQGAPNLLQGTKRPTIAETEMILAVAGGGLMQMVHLGFDAVELLSADTYAPHASHVVANKSRLVANDLKYNRAIIRFSDVATGDTYPDWEGIVGHTQWHLGDGTAGFLMVQDRPDPVVAVYDTVGELVVFGTTTVQIFAPDQEEVWSPVGTLEAGCGAPYSVIRYRDKFYWLDNHRRFVVSDGSGVTEVDNSEIQSELDDLGTVDDCFGFLYQQANVVCLVWVFPTSGVTYSWQPGVGWCRWSGWSGVNWTPFMVASHHQRFEGAENIVGTLDGHVSELTMAANTDLGETIRAYVETGYQSHGTLKPKKCKNVRFLLRRGAIGSTGPQAYFGFRDRPGPWEARIPIELGAAGDTEAVVPFHGLGVYEKRDWFFEFTGAERLELIEAIEEYEIIER